MRKEKKKKQDEVIKKGDCEEGKGRKKKTREKKQKERKRLRKNL